MGAVILSASVPVVLPIVLPIVTLIAGFVVGFAIYHFVLKSKTDRSKKFANKMVEEAIVESKNLRKEAVAEGKSEVQKERSAFENEKREHNAEVQRTEQRLQQRESSLFLSSLDLVHFVRFCGCFPFRSVR